MDLTPNRNYPFPQCDPPLVKDAANAPVQTRALAEAMDADFTTIDTLIESTYQLPTTILRISAATSIASGDDVPFDVVEYDPQGWATGDTVAAPPGLWLVTGFAGSVAGVNVQSLAVQFTGDGSGFFLQGTSPPASGFGRMTASGVTNRVSGAALGMRVFYSGTSPSNFDNCWLSATRLVAL
jgi:hypothetical protein